MDRKEFLKLMGFSASAFALLNILSSCDSFRDNCLSHTDDEDDDFDEHPEKRHKDDECNDDESNNGNQNSPTNVDFTIDLDNPNYAFLKSKGESLIKDNVIVAHTIDDAFIAVSAICTHKGARIIYDDANNNFLCPKHNSRFATNGNVLSGPAKRHLQQYIVELNGSLLRVHS